MKKWFRSMSKEGAFLRAWTLWTAWTWITLVRNMVLNADDRPLSFRLVHIALAVISLTFAAVAWPMAKKFDRMKRAEAIERDLVRSHNA